MYQVDIAEAARSNDAFRRVLHTTEHLQLVVMALQPGEDIGAEVHEHNDQLLTFVEGQVRAEVGGVTSEVGPGGVVVAARERAEFLERSSAVFAPQQEAEYATLLAREQSTYRQRQEAVHQLGLHADSIEPDET